MSEPSWQRVFEIFERAIECPDSHRAQLIEDLCRGDRRLRTGVEELLRAHDQQTSVLDRPIPARQHLVRSDDRRPSAPREEEQITRAGRPAEEASPEAGDLGSLGPYRPLRQIGQGGMSTVYLATRDDEAFDRRMVIKVIRADKQSAAMLGRLRAERQILADLEHANIARLYDGGSTEEGVPYFVMEFVDGLPVDAFCARNELSVDERLTLFRKICGAVHYAHQNLVVHRDIKPSNILVTAEGEPKLLDFGIAKLLDPEKVSSEAEPTAPWQRLMTPSFASPEQIAGGQITTVSDVYSLGVLLYVLLTGRLPHSFSGLDLLQIERLLHEEEPETPSRARAEQTRGEATRSAETDTASGVRPEALDADIDAIVLKALRSEPQQRYVSVERFAADIERFQEGLPVEARSGTWRYRAGKFIRRHRRSVAAAALVALTLAGSAVAIALQSRRVASERDQKSKVVDLVVEVFRLSDPYVTPGEELTVRDAVERSLPLIEARLRNQPEVRAELLHTTGSILGSLGYAEKASEHLQEALELRRGAFGGDPVEVAQTMSVLAAAQRDSTELERAEELARGAVDILRRHLGPNHPDLIFPLLQLISVYCTQELYEEAEPLTREVLALTEQIPDGQLAAIEAHEYLAQGQSARGDYDQAVSSNRRALELSIERFGESYPDHADMLTNIGVQLRRTGQLGEAREAYERAFEIQRRNFGEDHASPVLTNNLASVYYAEGSFERAEELYGLALKQVVERYGPDVWMVTAVRLRIARSRIHQGHAVEAEGTIRQLLAQPPLPAEHWLIDEARGALGESLSVQGRCEPAHELLVASYQQILEKIERQRIRREAFDRLREHLLRCQRGEEVASFEDMLKAAPRGS